MRLRTLAGRSALVLATLLALASPAAAQITCTEITTGADVGLIGVG